MRILRKICCCILCTTLLLPLGQVFAHAEQAIILLGDVDLDGKVTEPDARQILRFSADLDEINDDLLFFACDFNGDGHVTAYDARVALRIAAGIEKPRYIFYGTFVFTTYGWGHGVGLSQEGAEYYAKNMGWDYAHILTHYYTGAVLKTDSAVSSQTLSIDGTVYSMKQGIARILDQEMNTYYNSEARKAQAVAIYSYLKYKYKDKNTNSWTASGVAWISNSKTPSSKTVTLVGEILGKYMAYNGTVINAVFSAASAGTTASSKIIWGGDLPYLQPVDSIGDVYTEYFGYQKTKTSTEVYTALTKAYGDKIALSDNPEEWIKILSHDSAVDENIGYVISVNVGGYTMKGEKLRSALKLKSPCFTFEFYPDG